MNKLSGIKSGEVVSIKTVAGLCLPPNLVNPWGVEPQSKEPESFILSIKLRVQKENSIEKRGKISQFSLALQEQKGKETVFSIAIDTKGVFAV